MKTIIIGGVATGASAAARLSRIKQVNDEVILLEKDAYISFANCGLPYYIGNVIQNRDDLILQTPESFKETYGVDVRVLNEALKIDPKEKQLTILDIQNNKTYTESYDYLILAPGANPIIPPISNMSEIHNAYTVRNIDDVDKINNAITATTKTATIIGGGFIGVEMAENLHAHGITITLIDKSNHILNNFDDEYSTIAENILIEKGINVLTNTSVESFNNNGFSLTLDSQEILQTDMIIFAIGIIPNTKLAIEAGLGIGVTGGLYVDEYLQTSDPFIFAGGDVIEIKHLITKKPTRIPLAGPANRHGRFIADNIYGMNQIEQGSLGTAVIKLFESTFATTGLTTGQLQKENLPYESVLVTRNNHAKYYPGATDIQLKLLFNPQTETIYGAQAFGESDVNRAIDIIATAITSNMSISDLPTLDLAYAPPYGAAKDIINIAGYTALNTIKQKHQKFTVQQVASLVENNIQIIDVRSPEEFAEGHIENSINIPTSLLPQKIIELNLQSPLYLTCRVGQRGYATQQLLKQILATNYDVYNLEGGYLLYQQYTKNN